jgi:Family of unknown function (DUF6101)
MASCQSTTAGSAEARRRGNRTETSVLAPQAVTSACLRAEDGLKRVEIGAEWICIRRRIAGLETWVNVPTQSYRGVNLRSEAESGLFEIVLLHMDASLEIVLTRTADDTDVIALWRDYARTLALPLLVEDAQGRLQPMEDHSVLTPFPRRFGSPLKNRRPRFLARRACSFLLPFAGEGAPLLRGG